MLIFESTEYVPKTAEAIEYFFENVLESEDSLLVVTSANGNDQIVFGAVDFIKI